MITCKFTCHGCRLIDHPFNVRAREPQEPIVTWLSFAVQPAMHEEHKRVSPWCTSQAADLKMPADGERIRDAPRH
jgi:hypothetical protein